MNTDNETLVRESSRRTFARLGYSSKEVKQLVNSMNEVLANYSVHYQKLRNFHWNVKGGDFFDIHEQFEIQYNHVKESIDDIAERIRVFGQTPLSTMRDYLERAEIEEADTDLSGTEMVREIIKDYEILLEYMFNVIELAITHGDSGTEDMFKSFVKTIEKNHWMMTSFIQKS